MAGLGVVELREDLTHRQHSSQSPTGLRDAYYVYPVLSSVPITLKNTPVNE